jgi:hypothetical protein
VWYGWRRSFHFGWFVIAWSVTVMERRLKVKAKGKAVCCLPCCLFFFFFPYDMIKGFYVYFSFRN